MLENWCENASHELCTNGNYEGSIARTRLEAFHTSRLEVVVAQGSQEAHKLSIWLF